MRLAELVAIMRLYMPWPNTVIGWVDASQGTMRLHFLDPTMMVVQHQAAEIMREYLPLTIWLETSCRGDISREIRVRQVGDDRREDR